MDYHYKPQVVDVVMSRSVQSKLLAVSDCHSFNGRRSSGVLVDEKEFTGYLATWYGWCNRP